MVGLSVLDTLTWYGLTFRIQVVDDDDDDDDDDVVDDDDGDADEENCWAGTVPPESCFFGQMLNIGALLLVITVFIR